MMRGLHARIACARFGEVLFLAGIPLIGLLSSFRVATGADAARASALLLAYALLLGHVYAFNDWSGLAHDRLNERRKEGPAFSVPPGELLALSLLLLAAGLCVSRALGSRVLLVASSIGLLSFLYSHERILLKAVPLLSSGIHLAAGTLYYLFGRVSAAPLDSAGISTGVYFGLLYAAGHLNHEALDYPGDLRAGLNTNAVRFGRTRVLYAGLSLILLSTAYLACLGAAGIVPAALPAAAAAAGLLYTLFFWRMIRPDARRAAQRPREPEQLFRELPAFRSGCRCLYAALGLFWIAVLFLRG